MKSPEDIGQIPQTPPEPESEKERQWLEKLVASGQYSSLEEARADIQKLLDSVVSPESNINKLIDQKIGEIVNLGSPLTNDLERETIIIQKLTEIFQERPELLVGEGFILDLSTPEWKKGLVRWAEHRETYSLMQRALRALAEKYEDDPLRKELTKTILDIFLAQKQETISTGILEGEVAYPKEIEYDYERFLQLSKEREEILPKVRSLLEGLSGGNAQETQKMFDALIKQVEEEINTHYPYLYGVEHQMEHRYAHNDEPKRLAVHVAGTGSIDLNLLRSDGGLYEILLSDIYDIKKVFDSYTLIESERTDNAASSRRIRTNISQKKPEETMTREDLKKLFGGWPRDFQMKLLGKTIEEAQQYLLDKLKSF